jgi:xanthine/uracil permease
VLAATALAFFLAVGLAAHALDELNGRPLRTAIADRMLWGVAVGALAGAVTLGAVGVARRGPALIPFIVVGVGLVLGYNLELFGGRLHTDLCFAAAWGGFPVVVGFVAQAPPLTGAAVAALAAAAIAAVALSYAQRCLSTPARIIRRRTRELTGVATLYDGTKHTLDRVTLLVPLEKALQAMSWAVPLLAAALVLARLSA